MWWFVLGQLFTMKTDFLQFCDIFLYSSHVFSSVSSLWNSPLWFLNLLDLPYYLLSFFLSTIPLSSCSWVFPQLLLFFHFCDHIFNFQELFLDLWVLVLVSLLTFCLSKDLIFLIKTSFYLCVVFVSPYAFWFSLFQVSAFFRCQSDSWLSLHILPVESWKAGKS